MVNTSCQQNRAQRSEYKYDQPMYNYSAGQRQTAVTAYVRSKQLLLFAFTRQY